MTTRRYTSLDEPIGERAPLSRATRYRDWSATVAGAISLLVIVALIVAATRGF
jgi:hypothetical protein